ncbi:sugar ABC transporter substrate-binding protein [Shewanella sp. WXL01]|uniref:sugar ABC transporter substrate-binding protein n=1 Tax=Shewanella sp. WXL01 TaxID=2709721 RepID=UPI0014382DF6|nr:sugar ABC transporter substrate-binding protein [Shewanella sp. WXL01]NKF50528.1 sugar ABC transporter substrate-binding protein [Shewanella sp. WXL01]
MCNSEIKVWLFGFAAIVATGFAQAQEQVRMPETQQSNQAEINWQKVVSLQGNELIQYVDSLKLSGQASLNFWKQLPLSHANHQVAHFYNSQAFPIYMRRYPRPQKDAIEFTPNMGTKIISPIDGNTLMLPFTDYYPIDSGIYGDAKKTYKIGFSTHGLDHPWLMNSAASAQWQANELTNVELSIADAQFDNQVQAKHIDTWIEQQYDGILIWPMQEAPTGPPVDRAYKANIPVVSIDRLVGSARVSKQITGNFAANGAQQAMYLVDRLYKELGTVKANVVLVRKPLGSTADAMRTGHFLKVLSYFPEINIIESVHNNSDREDSLQQVAKALVSHSIIDVVFCTGAEQAMGAVKAIDDANRWNSRAGGNKVIVLSNDELHSSLDAIKEGKIAMAAPYTPFLASLGLRVLLKHIETGTGHKNITTPDLPMITKQRMNIFGVDTLSAEDWLPYSYGSTNE